MICGAADEGSAALFVWGGARSWGWRTGGGAGSARRADRREIVVCGRGECVGGRGEGLDSPGGRIGVSLLTGAKFGDRMKKNISGVFCA